MTIGKNIKKRREELNLTQRNLADILGYKTLSTISRIESDSIQLSGDKINIIAEALQTTPAEILGEPGDENTIRDGDEKKLITNFRNMNIEGKVKLIEHSELMAASGLYKKISGAGSSQAEIG